MDFHLFGEVISANTALKATVMSGKSGARHCSPWLGRSSVRALNIQRPLALRCATSPRLPARLLPSGKQPGTSIVSPGLNAGYQLFERRPTKSGCPAHADSWAPVDLPFVNHAAGSSIRSRASIEMSNERREQWNQRLDRLHSLRERFIRSDQFERAQRVGRVVHYAYDRWAAEVFAKPR